MLNSYAMKTSDPKAPPKLTAREAREQRLAQALRDNLRRRRGLKPGPSPGDDED
jgi:hypothetical protein